MVPSCGFGTNPNEQFAEVLALQHADKGIERILDSVYNVFLVSQSAIGDPGAWGIDYAMPAMFTALLVGQIEKWPHAITAALAAVLALLFAWLLPGTWFLVAASVAASVIAAVVFR